MITGSCYCGAVTYEIHGRLLALVNCHCPDCRKFSGSAYVSILVTEADGFRITAGEDALVLFASSPGKQRSFCRTCGCHIVSRAAHRPTLVFVRAGTLNDDPGIRAQAHYWTSVKAPWHDITDALPQHPEGVPKNT